nr:MAG TPA: hypothetical protein [Caudoviricetes sp.]
MRWVFAYLRSFSWLLTRLSSRLRRRPRSLRRDMTM